MILQRTKPRVWKLCDVVPSLTVFRDMNPNNQEIWPKRMQCKKIFEKNYVEDTRVLPGFEPGASRTSVLLRVHQICICPKRESYH